MSRSADAVASLTGWPYRLLRRARSDCKSSKSERCNRFYDLRSDRKVWGPATSSQGSEVQPIPGASCPPADQMKIPLMTKGSETSSYSASTTRFLWRHGQKPEQGSHRNVLSALDSLALEAQHELPTRCFPTMQNVAYALSDSALHWHGLDMCIKILSGD